MQSVVREVWQGLLCFYTQTLATAHDTFLNKETMQKNQ